METIIAESKGPVRNAVAFKAGGIGRRIESTEVSWGRSHDQLRRVALFSKHGCCRDKPSKPCRRIHQPRAVGVQSVPSRSSYLKCLVLWPAAQLHVLHTDLYKRQNCTKRRVDTWKAAESLRSAAVWFCSTFVFFFIYVHAIVQLARCHRFEHRPNTAASP